MSRSCLLLPALLLLLLLKSGEGGTLRMEERDGGLYSIVDAMAKVRSGCKVALGVESTLTTFPLSLISNLVLSLPLPIPNPLILDPLRLYEFSQTAMQYFQDSVNSVNQNVGVNMGKRDLSDSQDLMAHVRSAWEKEVPLLQSRIRELHDRMTSHVREREAEDPSKPGYLLRFSDLITQVKYLCPLVDLGQTFLTSSAIKFLNLGNLPLPIPNGGSINLIKALDIYNVSGFLSNFPTSLTSMISNFFAGTPPTTTPAPSGGFLGLGNLFGGAAAPATTAKPSSGGFLGLGNLFGGGAAAAPPVVTTAAPSGGGFLGLGNLFGGGAAPAPTATPTAAPSGGFLGGLFGRSKTNVETALEPDEFVVKAAAPAASD